MELDRKYFKVISTKTIDGEFYKVVRPIGPHMVLFSKMDGLPLASLSLRCPTGVKTVITKRYSGETDFQGMITKDGQEFELVITNLTTDGLINFNIMKNDTPVVDVDPGAEKGGLNQVNELHALQSYAIQCDQKDNMSLVLNSIHKDSGKNLTVKEAEKSPVPKGTKYYLSVVPQVDNPSLVAKFAETFWACVDVFFLYSTRNVYRRAVQSADRGYSTRSISRCIPECGPIVLESFTRSKAESLIPEEEDEEEEDGDMGFDLFGAVTDVTVANSLAATVSGGRRINVQSGCTGKTYAFDTPSVKCCFGLSIVENLAFVDAATDEELDAIAETMIAENISRVSDFYKEQLGKVFESESCVICLDDDNPPNTIFYACGHKCSHLDCSTTIRTCPMCRLSITAKIKA